LAGQNNNFKAMGFGEKKSCPLERRLTNKEWLAKEEKKSRCFWCYREKENTESLALWKEIGKGKWLPPCSNRKPLRERSKFQRWIETGKQSTQRLGKRKTGRKGASFIVQAC